MIAYQDLLVSTDQASRIALELFGHHGKAIQLDGDVDFNYKIKTDSGSFILKISRPDEDLGFLDFQQKTIQHIENVSPDICAPRVINDLNGNEVSLWIDDHGNERRVRLLSWIDGRLWSSVNPQTDDMRYQLGELCGKMTKTFRSFDHPNAHRNYDWDLAQTSWTEEHLDRYEGKERLIIAYFQQRFRSLQSIYQNLPKSIVHADPNDNNIVVDGNLVRPNVIALIDYGDAIHTQTVNDLAVTAAYAIMFQNDPLSAILPLVTGYNKYYSFSDDELKCLYTLVACRLFITIIKGTINIENEPDNEYHIISRKPAWDALKKWFEVNGQFAYYSFRKACKKEANPKNETLSKWFESNKISIDTVFPGLNKSEFVNVDMSVSSTWLGNRKEYENEDLTRFKLSQLVKQYPNSIVSGGYSEVRPLYTTEAYRSEGNSGYEYRNTHLGIDYWLDAGTSIHAPFDGEIVTLFDNDQDKDYGPTIILKHEVDRSTFYTLYGHLGRNCLDRLKLGQHVKQGELIAEIGDSSVNGNWTPHLHFQIMLDLLGNKTDFPGTAIWNQLDVWKSICPDPNLIFDASVLGKTVDSDSESIQSYRKEHLGKSLSLSYSEPLHIVRGEGVHLIDSTGRKYLDTVNNVAHVGHENPRVVKAGQSQMGVLNTNTRYLNENINSFAQELLATLPDELSVIHFVNSGSEANELALRMAKVCTGQKDMIAVEIGYHGNANACIDISSYKFDSKGGQGAPEHTHIVPLPDSFRGIYQGADTGEKYASHVQTQLDSIQAKGRNVAAFIAEPIISCGGQIEPPKNYLKTAYEAVRKAGGVCISDEVQVGFGRVGKAFWGFELQNVIPDIVTMGKPIGNGHPLAAIACTKDVAEKFANGMEYFNTFGGNPVSSAIGKEILQIIKEEKLQENALNVGDFLKAELNKMREEFPVIGDVRGQGLFLGIELVNEKKEPLADQAEYLANRMKSLGVLMSTDGPQHNILKIKPPMVFSMENAQELLLRLETVFQEDFMKES